MKHYMELSDGTCIEAYLKSDLPDSITPDTFGLDTTGEFLHMGTKPKRLKRIVTCTNKAEQRLFLRYAHRLIAESDRILEDSRMFLALLPMRNGLAYFGTSGMRNPTLGVYIEWWRNHEAAWAEDETGTLQPLYHITGSPLSGCNKCAYVGADGESHTTSVPHFSRVWSTFAKLNSRYTEAKQVCESYTLEEVIERLFGESIYDSAE